MSCVLCILYCQFLWIVYYWLPPSVFSNVYFCPVSCVSYIASFSGLSIIDCPLRYSLTFIGLSIQRELNIFYCSDISNMIGHKWPRICSVCRNYSNASDATSGTGTAAYLSTASGFTLGFHWGSCYSIFSFLCNVL